ncbi:hypothetical protein MauCBS54593_005317 [Microsporum audouinii]
MENYEKPLTSTSYAAILSELPQIKAVRETLKQIQDSNKRIAKLIDTLERQNDLLLLSIEAQNELLQGLASRMERLNM